MPRQHIVKVKVSSVIAHSSLECAMTETLVTGERTGSVGSKFCAITLRTGSVPRPCRPPSHMHVNTLVFPRTLMEIFSSCRNQSSRSWHPRVNVQLWGSVFLLRGDEEMRWKGKLKKNVEPTWRSFHPWRATLNTLCADLRIAFFSGSVGKVSSVSMVLRFYGLPAGLFTLACLSRLSTVEKDTDFETYQIKKK